MDDRRDTGPTPHARRPLERRLAALRETLSACLAKARSWEGRSTALQAQLHRVEEKRHRDSAELATLYESAPLGLAVVDRDLRYLRINETLACLNGLPAADHIGRTIPELFPRLEQVARSVTSTIPPPAAPSSTSSLPAPCPRTQTRCTPGQVTGCPSKTRMEPFRPSRLGVIEITDRKRAEAALNANVQAQEFLIAAALRLLQPIEHQERFDFVTARIYSVTDGAIVLFSEFEPAGDRTILRAPGIPPEERARAHDVLGRDPPASPSRFPSRCGRKCCLANSRGFPAGSGS